MFIDSTAFPVVRMDFRQILSDGEHGFAQFEALLDREQPFVVIAYLGDDRHDHNDHDPAERKRVTLWMKAHRQRMTRLVKAMIYVEANPLKRVTLQASSIIFKNFCGYPLLVVASERDVLPSSDDFPSRKETSGSCKDMISPKTKLMTINNPIILRPLRTKPSCSAQGRTIDVRVVDHSHSITNR